MEITTEMYQKYRDELREVEDRLQFLYHEQEEAREFGDLSENEEYQAVSMEIRVLSTKKSDLTELLKDAVLIEKDDGIRLSIGSQVRITEEGGDGECLELTLEEKGDPLTKGILGVNSPLGQAILNGTSGEYTIHLGRTYRYKVEKL